MSTLCATVPLTFGQIERLPYRERQQAYDKMLAPLRRYEAERWAKEHQHSEVKRIIHVQPSKVSVNLNLNNNPSRYQAPVLSIPSHKCAFCQKSYDSLRSTSLYCSVNCRQKSYQRRRNPQMTSTRGRPKQV